MILLSSPVCEFLPFLAFLCPILKDRKPISVTVSFFFNAFVMVEKEPTAALASLLVLTTLATSLTP